MIIGVSKSASATGVRGELGWKKIENEMIRKRLIWWAKIIQKDEKHWTNKIQSLMIKENWSSLNKRINDNKIEMGISNEDLKQKNWKTIINNKVNKKMDEEWKKDKEKSKILKYMIKENSKDLRADTNINSKWARKAKLGDNYSITGETNPIKCKKCNNNIACIVQHILSDCTITRKTRYKKNWPEKYKEETEKDWLIRNLADKSSSKTLGQTLHQWTQAQNHH